MRREAEAKKVKKQIKKNRNFLCESITPQTTWSKKKINSFKT
jgi:hypothetical protein